MSSTSVNNKGLQGIGSILGSSEHPRSASLRRTLSADMSSKKWLAQSGFTSMKKTASSEQLQVDANSQDLEQPSQLDIWNSIQSDKQKTEPKQSDIWSSILSQKSSPLPAPYVHPLTKRSRSLSQKSLEICTESLGSETGSDGYSSSYTPSETSDTEPEQDVEDDEEQEPIKDEFNFADYNRYCSRKLTTTTASGTPSRSFPPPLPSLSRPGLHMRPRRIDGRLVVEAVSVPTPSHNFHAQRHDGRLLLTFIKSPSSTNAERNNQDEETEDSQEQTNLKIEQDEEEEQGKDIEKTEEKQSKKGELLGNNKIVVEMKPIVPTGVIDVQLSAHRMKKLMSITNRNPTTTTNWSSKLKQLGEIEDDDPAPPSLPPLSLHSASPASSRVPRLISSSVPATTAASFNTYEYCWRTKQATFSIGIKHPLTSPFSTTSSFSTTASTKSYNKRSLVSKNLNPQHEHHHQYRQFVVLQANYTDPTLGGCKEPRKNLLLREPCCIATS